MFTVADLIAEWEKLRTQSGKPHQSKPLFYFSRFSTVMICGAAYLFCQLSIPLFYIPIDHFFPSIPDKIAALILYVLIALGFATGYLAAKVMDSILS
jgi:hypothetical protein